MDRIRIAQLVGNTELGGVSNCVLNYFRYVDRERFFFDFLTYGETKFDDKVRALGGETHEINDFRNPLKACKELKNVLKNNAYDIFHCHLTSLSVFPLYVAKKENIGVKIVHSHSATDGKEKTAAIKNVLKKYADRYADARFACSESAGKWLYGNKPFTLVKNAIDTERFSYKTEGRERLRKEYNIDGLCMGFAGRFEPQKNLFRFLDVAEEVQKRADSVAVLVGNGSQKGELQKYAQERKIKALFIDGSEEMENWYSAFDCLVMPSLYEGLPLVGVEAQACTLPTFFADTITKEADFGGATYFDKEDLSIADLIVKSGEKRVDCSQEISRRGYDVRQEAKNLENLYLTLLKK